jgi:hypothetical protein
LISFFKGVTLNRGGLSSDVREFGCQIHPIFISLLFLFRMLEMPGTKPKV